MAQIKIKRTHTPGKVPEVGLLKDGELAVNLADGTLFAGTADDETSQPVQIGGVQANQLSEVAFTGRYEDLVGKPTDPGEYILPPATTTALGGVMPKDGLTVQPDGSLVANVVSVNDQTGQVVITPESIGVPTVLGPDGKLLSSVIPDSLLGGVSFLGSWDASTNTPTIPAASPESAGSYYIVSVAGNTTIDGISDWAVSDWVLSDGTKWVKIQTSATVDSVNGQRGTVELTATDIPGISAVGKTGNYSDLLGKPEIPPAYTLPPATTTTRGGVTVGNGIDVDTSGKISLSAKFVPPPKYVISILGLLVPNTTALVIAIDQPVLFPANFANSIVRLLNPVNGPVTGQLRKGSTVIGTFNIQANNTSGTFQTSPAVTFDVGDMMVVFITAAPVQEIQLGITLVSVNP